MYPRLLRPYRPSQTGTNRAEQARPRRRIARMTRQRGGVVRRKHGFRQFGFVHGVRGSRFLRRRTAAFAGLAAGTVLIVLLTSSVAVASDTTAPTRPTNFRMTTTIGTSATHDASV